MNHNHHFLVISFPIQSHINPILQLAKNLARAGVKVTFVTTVLGLKRLSKSLPSIKGLSYASFSDGHDEEIEQSSNHDWLSYFNDFTHIGSENLTKLIQNFNDEGQPVTCLVYSLLIPWAAQLAREARVPSAFVAIQGASVFAIYHHFFKDDEVVLNGGIDSSASVTIPGLPVFSVSDLPNFLLPDNILNKFMAPMTREHMKELKKEPEAYVFLNTFQELEPEAIKELGLNLNVIPIGPLIPSAFSDRDDLTDKSFGGDLFSKSEEYIHWLDSKPEHSVIYIAFGSLVAMSKEQKDEISLGLMESKRPFMWVIRTKDSEDEEMKNMLENEGNGIIVSWCSQIEVLSHKSVGCFVTHCGWNSTLESLTCGVPVIGCPYFSDQITNAMLLEDVWKTGVRARVNGDVTVGREELRKCLDLVMGDGDRGEEIRRNAAKWRGLAIEAVSKGGSTYGNLIRVLLGDSN